MNSFAAAWTRFWALSERIDSGMPKIEKVFINAMTASIAVSSLTAWSMTNLERSSSMTKIFVAAVKEHGVEIDMKSTCQRPKSGASVRIVLYIA